MTTQCIYFNGIQTYSPEVIVFYLVCTAHVCKQYKDRQFCTILMKLFYTFKPHFICLIQIIHSDFLNSVFCSDSFWSKRISRNVVLCMTL